VSPRHSLKDPNLNIIKYHLIVRRDIS